MNEKGSSPPVGPVGGSIYGSESSGTGGAGGRRFNVNVFCFSLIFIPDSVSDTIILTLRGLKEKQNVTLTSNTSYENEQNLVSGRNMTHDHCSCLKGPTKTVMPLSIS